MFLAANNDLDMEVEVTLDPQLEHELQPEFIYFVINSLAAAVDGHPAPPPVFRDELGPAPPAQEEDVHHEELESPDSPDPYADECDSSDAESDSSLASTIIWCGHDSGSPTDDEGAYVTSDDEEGRLVIDLDSPRSPSPTPPEDMETEEDRRHHHALYQPSVNANHNILAPRR